MPIGTVKWFNPTKGYGFISPEKGSSDVFVHTSEAEKSGYFNLEKGQKLSYDIARNNGKTGAVNLQKI